MTTEATIAKLYRDACREDGPLPADLPVADLIDLAHGRLAGERRARLVNAIASSPALASAYRLAKAGGEWSRALAADLARESGRSGIVRALPTRQARPALAVRRHPLALAAAVGVMAIGAVFVTQQLRSPVAGVDGDFASASAYGGGDAIASHSFDAAGRTHAADVIFTTQDVSDNDRIFRFGKGS